MPSNKNKSFEFNLKRIVYIEFLEFYRLIVQQPEKEKKKIELYLYARRHVKKI